MPAFEHYRRQAKLLVKTMPLVAAESCFALKGGTAINLFIRDMPRISVDMDLTYLPAGERSSSLSEIDSSMRRIGERICRGIPGARISHGLLGIENCVTKLVVRADGVQIKIEVTPVLRGCVFEPLARTVSPKVEDTFGFAEMLVVSFADLYAGKIVAALDRQHPRDLFDVRLLLANEGISDQLRSAFIVYLLSHNRPMAELLAPPRLDIVSEFERGFQGMTEVPVTVEELLSSRDDLIAAIIGNMPQHHRRFLLSFKRGEPEWELLNLPAVESLPAVRWKIQNLANLDRHKRSALLAKLEEALGTG